MPDIQIPVFRGINFEEENWSQGFGKYVYGMDIFGLQDNTSLISFPGVLQGARTVSAGLQASGVSAVSTLIREFTYYPTAGTVWGLSDGNHLYERDSSNAKWTLRRSAGSSPALTTGGGGGTEAFNGRLWVADDGNLNYQSGAYPGTWATLNALSSTTPGPRPMKSTSTFLFVGDNNIIARVDSSNAFTSAALTLPSNFVIADIELFGNNLLIIADNRTSTSGGTFSRLFVWDGVSTTFQSYIDILDEGNAPNLVSNEGMVWLISNRGATTPGCPVYTYNGYTVQKVMQLPIQMGSISNVAQAYRGGVLIGSTDTSSGAYEDGVAGIWMINRADSSHPYQA